MSIKDITEKIKQGREGLMARERGLYFVALILVMSSLSFGLGRLSLEEERRVPVRVELPALVSAPEVRSGSTVDPPPVTKVAVPSVAPAGATEVVASRSGTKYHFLTCGSAKSIKPENRITFPSEQAAMAAGYTLAKTCKR